MLLIRPRVPTSVEAWSFSLRDALGSESWLDDGERDRAARFATRELREAFAAAHVGRRALLARFEGRAAGELVFAETAQGKPFLVESRLDTRFSFSRSERAAALAIAAGVEVGADLEPRSRTAHADEILRGFATPAEQRWFFAQPEDERPEAFLRWWVAKEAVLKCIGTGLSGLGDVEVTFDASRAQIAGGFDHPLSVFVGEALGDHLIAVAAAADASDVEVRWRSWQGARQREPQG